MKVQSVLSFAAKRPVLSAFVGGGVALLVMLIVAFVAFSKLNVEIKASSSVVDGQIVVKGTTNLRDGALIACEAQPIDNREFSLAEATVEVRNGMFECVMKPTVVGQHEGKLAVVNQRPSGIWSTWVGFQTVSNPPQPQWVTSLYGERGQRMAGSYVEVGSKKNPMRRVEVKDVVRF